MISTVIDIFDWLDDFVSVDCQNWSLSRSLSNLRNVRFILCQISKWFYGKHLWPKWDFIAKKKKKKIRLSKTLADYGTWIRPDESNVLKKNISIIGSATAPTRCHRTGGGWLMGIMYVRAFRVMGLWWKMLPFLGDSGLRIAKRIFLSNGFHCLNFELGKAPSHFVSLT